MQPKVIEFNRENIEGFLLSALLAIFLFIVNLFIKGPMIQADEGSYLANAAALAGFHNDMASSYHAGYSLLIAPAFWFAHTPSGVFPYREQANIFLFKVLIYITLIKSVLRVYRKIWECSCSNKLGQYFFKKSYPKIFLFRRFLLYLYCT